MVENDKSDISAEDAPKPAPKKRGRKPKAKKVVEVEKVTEPVQAAADAFDVDVKEVKEVKEDKEVEILIQEPMKINNRTYDVLKGLVGEEKAKKMLNLG